MNEELVSLKTEGKGPTRVMGFDLDRTQDLDFLGKLVDEDFWTIVGSYYNTFLFVFLINK